MIPRLLQQSLLTSVLLLFFSSVAIPFVNQLRRECPFSTEKYAHWTNTETAARGIHGRVLCTSVVQPVKLKSAETRHIHFD
ncbi:MAG: hypothetical protein J3Q66DRAFT_58578 [Benniella sp.]|nr:MAG: hypothetical protein J3Q66DRAFT_58578 [Benniella sp.]